MQDKLSVLMSLLSDVTSRKFLVACGVCYGIYSLIEQKIVNPDWGTFAIIVVALAYLIVQTVLDNK